MTAAPGLHVSVEYTLTLASGEVADRSAPGRPLAFVVGAGQVIAGLEAGVVGMAPGESRRLTVEPDEGYGWPDPEMVREVPRAGFPPDADLTPGRGFTARGPAGPVAFRVRSSDGETVWADFSHPLAGERLFFDVTVVEVRERRPDEPASSGECSPAACEACGSGCGG